MFAFLRKARPAGPDYTALFDYDEARLAAGSGSELLDAFLRNPETRQMYADRVDLLPQTGAILAADPWIRGDIYARLWALSVNNESRPARNQKLPESFNALLYLRMRLRGTEMRLASAAAAPLIKASPDYRVLGYLPLGYDGRSDEVSCEFRTLVVAALQAGEKSRDRDFDALLKTALARYERQFPAQIDDARAGDEFARLCLAALGRDVESFGPVKLFAQGQRAYEHFIAPWRDRAPEALWRFVEETRNRVEFGAIERIEAAKQDMLSQSPPARGATTEAIWRFARALGQTPSGLPWRYESFLEIRVTSLPLWSNLGGHSFLAEPFDELLSRACQFSPEFALELVQDLSWDRWNASVRFAKSLAASLPRTAAARQAVERRLKALDGQEWRISARELSRQQVILLDIFQGSNRSDRLDNRAAAAKAAFETALSKARAEKAAEWARIKSMPAKLAENYWRNQRQEHFPERTLTRLGGLDGPCELLALASAAAKFGAGPEVWAGCLAEIEEDILRARRDLGLAAERDASDIRAETDAHGALGATRAATALFAPLTAAERAAYVAVEDHAAHAPSGAAPSAKWLRTAETLAKAPEASKARDLVLALAAAPAFLNNDRAFSALSHTPPLRRALVWQLAFHPADEVARPLGDLALRALAPSPQGGITNELIGNAALWSLANLPAAAGLPTLARIGARTRYPKVRQRINALFETAAAKAGRSRAEIEEDIAPLHGFDAGRSHFALVAEAGSAELALSARGKAEIIWRNEAGRIVKAPSAAMKLADAAGMKAIKEAVREIQLDYGVQAKRVEKLYRSTRTLGFDRWRGAYVDHPFVGLIARRLIWRAGDVVGSGATAASRMSWARGATSPTPS